jgi:hypothetical protein
VRRLAAAGLIVLADKRYIGAGEPVITPYRRRNKPPLQKAANGAHAQLRAPPERANAQLKTWHILRKLRCCPCRAGQLAKAIHRSSDLRDRRMKNAHCATVLLVICYEQRTSVQMDIGHRKGHGRNCPAMFTMTQRRSW